MSSYEDMHCKILHYFEPITDYREMANAMSFVWNSTFARPSGSGRKFHNSHCLLKHLRSLLYFALIPKSTEVSGSNPIKTAKSFCPLWHRHTYAAQYGIYLALRLP